VLASLLIANRGEIACRIIRTCRRLGIRTVAVFSDADAAALHVAAADEAVRLGPPPAAESYLRIDAVLEAAKRSGAAAIHPGYGFLAENAAFARAVRDAGLVFVGPPPEAMELMGGKDTAKRVMAAAGVPLVPGYHDTAQDDAVLAEAAARIGFPLLIKAAAGGGGKGMRRVDAAAAFRDALAACRREAAAAFGDDRVLLERLIERPRHVEVQVMADRHGRAVHLHERDCTLQRRHQKVVEEAPAPGLPAEIRAALAAAAVEAARASGYENAGTVEFLVAPDGGFYFIEMNTRLQVEHPVTELITGLDLVEWQLRIAAGEPLPLTQEQIASRGHAVEARLYAEDPERGFLPSTGRLERLRLPADRPGVRIDTGVAEGDLVTPFYDPMIAKIIVHGPDRAAALAGLAHALDACEVEGPATNLAFLRAIVTAPAMAGLAIDTGWLDREGVGQGAAAADPLDPVLAALACAFLDQSSHDRSPWTVLTGWRLNAPPRRRFAFRDDGDRIDVVLEGMGERLVAQCGGLEVALRAGSLPEPGVLWIELDGRRRRFRAYRHGRRVTVIADGRRRHFDIDPGLGAGAEEAGADTLTTAPMPGKVTRLFVATGERVVAGQPLAILEAMKMEHRFEAPRAGTVTAIHVQEGDQVEEGAVLLDLEPLAEAP
jgi:3-methylcrotonyl-CoA carboxylase alpha subunit